MGGVDDLLTNIADDVDGIAYPSSVLVLLRSKYRWRSNEESYIIGKSVIDDIVDKRKSADNPRKTPSVTEIGDNLGRIYIHRDDRRHSNG